LQTPLRTAEWEKSELVVNPINASIYIVTSKIICIFGVFGKGSNARETPKKL
jgi:hypothetical protein